MQAAEHWPLYVYRGGQTVWTQLKGKQSWLPEKRQVLASASAGQRSQSSNERGNPQNSSLVINSFYSGLGTPEALRCTQNIQNEYAQIPDGYKAAT